MPTYVHRPSAVELIDVDRFDLVETDAPCLGAEHQAEVDRQWDVAVKANPSLFDGPIAVCAGLDRRGRDVSLEWARATYRRLALRDVKDAPAVASLFVAVVQPTDEGPVLLGRMSTSTAAPGRWQLPGGIVEPPGVGEALDADALRRHAAVELAEETGITVPAPLLSLWVVTRGIRGSIGVLFVAPPEPAESIERCFDEHLGRERRFGRDPELTELAFVGSATELDSLGDHPRVDYLDDVVARFRRRDAR